MVDQAVEIGSGGFDAPAEAESETDHCLVAAARTNRAAFGQLYRRYVDAIYAYCVRRLGDRTAAEDATSQVFERALVALPRYRTDKGSFRGWLFTIAHNVIADELHRREPSRHQPLDHANAIRDAAPGPEELAIETEDQRLLRRLLTLLPPDDQRLLELRLAGLTGPEIARVLGRRPGAVRVAQFRAIARIRALLDHERSRPDAP